MEINPLALSQQTLSEYLLYMQEKPAAFFEQVYSNYPWIFSQLERLQTLGEQHRHTISVRESNKIKREALKCLQTFVYKFQNLYLAESLRRKLPPVYQYKREMPFVDFFERFIEKAQTETQIFSALYLSEAPSLQKVFEALKIYKSCQNTPQLSRSEYLEIAALQKSLQAFLPLIKNIALSEKISDTEASNKKLPDWVKVFLKQER